MHKGHDTSSLNGIEQENGYGYVVNFLFPFS